MTVIHLKDGAEDNQYGIDESTIKYLFSSDYESRVSTIASTAVCNFELFCIYYPITYLTLLTLACSSGPSSRGGA